MIEDNRVYNNGRNVVYECDRAPGRCFVHGDSMAYAALSRSSSAHGQRPMISTPTEKAMAKYR